MNTCATKGLGYCYLLASAAVACPLSAARRLLAARSPLLAAGRCSPPVVRPLQPAAGCTLQPAAGCMLQTAAGCTLAARCNLAWQSTAASSLALPSHLKVQLHCSSASSQQKIAV